MKSKDVKLNETYLVKVSGNLVPVRITREHPSGTGYYGTNTVTGREIRLRTAARLRRVAPPSPRAFKSQPGDAERLDGSEGPKSMSELFKV